ncbi:hypothetical protein EKL29_08030 [Pantoea sp. YU22]|uniref:DUF7446 family protein n=1 Tax=Pantoea sp. YU22 TaxID=2497684 RepID=UPI000F8794F1|nr:hypothetical protein [Pantoea sp. YU22]RTY58771.1 hypothetical protein EKL29_08030 [Pantoea sp. YU22]
MPNPLTLGFSGLSGKIFAGRSKAMAGAPVGIRLFIGEKHDVTDDALSCVAEKILNQGEPVMWDMGDGRVLKLSVEIIEMPAE